MQPGPVSRLACMSTEQANTPLRSTTDASVTDIISTCICRASCWFLLVFLLVQLGVNHLSHLSVFYLLLLSSSQTAILSYIYKTYIGETHYKSWLDFSQHASIPRHHPLCAMSPSTIRHVIIHQITYLCLQSIFCGSCISHHKILADDFRMIHSQQNKMLSYIMSLQTNIAM
jgi:hypothetical protein